MIFTPEALRGLKRWGGIYYIREYHPATFVMRNGNTAKSKFFDEYSRAILNLKAQNDGAIKQFCIMLDSMLLTEFAIAVVPSHKTIPNSSGIRKVAQCLAQKGGRIDVTNCLVRHKEIPALHERNSRECRVHLESIVVAHIKQLNVKEVLLLDDIATSGNSISVCRKLLSDVNKSLKIECLVLGKTV